jgi:RNA polymerase sigma factor (sigma-70 family)
MTIEAMWLTYQRQIAAYIAKYVRTQGQETVDDMVSIVYLRAMVATRNGNGCTDNALAWLYAIARSVMWDAWRAKKHMTYVEWESLAEMAADFAVEDEAERNITRAKVRQAIGKLSARQEDTMQLRLMGYSYDEAGAVLGCSEGAAKGIGIRAYENLRRMLQEPQP